MAWRSKIVLIILLIVASLVGIYFCFQLAQERKLQADYKALVNRVNELQQENASLEDELAKIQNEQEVERLGRELYALKKPDEKVMIIPQEVMQQLLGETASSNLSSQAPSKISQWFQELKHFLSNLF
ncbi:MAG TPA: septum formation initiator family protein [Candidatus Paceibacterota bacterium]|nr:septum formation initiator family protein [Candidatus Paceibacterota bacterium]HOL54045.1 septum formation initiator family protein [Candidatus Paceibacterota bacterium]HON21985.1 septum formation initiator family protein [Candidatus Paceibacterota bacterium]HOV88577.1 septum formation initiator family protein [Candidatus Paceibacterota bacterium]HPP17002.1 septum formation initiator family protein [Candidatus Paceibacterota bacterium]